jgi:type I restriction enzyme, S subunit
MPWRTLRLEDCARIVGGATPSTMEPRFWDGGVFWATPKDLSDLDGFAYLDSTPRRITDAGLSSCAAEVLPPYSVLFSSRAPIGLVAINRVPTATNQGFKSFVPDPEKLDAKYLRHWLLANRERLQALGNGATFKEVSKAIVSRIEIPVPPLSEQRRIAAILDQAEELRGKRREAIAKLEGLRQSIFADAVIRHEAHERRIGELLATGELRLHKDGNHGSLYPRAEDFEQDGVPFISAQSIRDDGTLDVAAIQILGHAKASQLKLGWIEKGDVLLAHNASVGKVALYDGRFDRALIGTSLTAFRPNPEAISSHFLAAALRAESFQAQLKKNMSQTTRNQVPITAQRELRVPMPEIRIQRILAERMERLTELGERSEAALDVSGALFNSLQHRAFRGEL